MSQSQQTGEVGDRAEWILRLLYAPVKGNTALPIVGVTRLMKGCFLMDRRLEEEIGRRTDFEFRPDKYGPLDPLVYDTVEQLERENLLARRESQDYNGTEFALTDDGKREGRNLFDALSDSEQGLLMWIKGKHVLNSLPKLLSFVYNQYPQMAKNSKLK